MRCCNAGDDQLEEWTLHSGNLYTVHCPAHGSLELAEVGAPYKRGRGPERGDWD